MYFKELYKENLNINENFTYKIIVIGDSGVGKSNFINRFFGKGFKPNSISTVGVELSSKIYEAMYTKGNTSCCDIIRVNVWDTAGQERYKSVASSYYKGSNGVFILYDTTKYNTFENVDNWISDTNLFCNLNTSIMLVGTKSDLYDLKVIEYSLLEEKAERYGHMYIESSAKEDENIKESFFKLLEDVHWKSINFSDNSNNSKHAKNVNYFNSSNKINNNCCN